MVVAPKKKKQQKEKALKESQIELSVKMDKNKFVIIDCYVILTYINELK